MEEQNSPATLVGVFDRQEDAEEAVAALEQVGFGDDTIGFLSPVDEDPERRMGRAVARSIAGATAVGGVAGGLLGALASGFIPGVGSVVAGGTLVAVVMGAATGGATGGVAAGLFSAAATEDERTSYSEFLRNGRTVVTLTVAGDTGEARKILADAGAALPSVQTDAEPGN
jgi:hypothetical protein